jgi:hypothetical protein
MVERGDGHLTDIYTHRDGRVLRLIDGLIAADNNYAPLKAARDALFPFEIIERASRFALARTEATFQKDFDNIMAQVWLQADGEKKLDATVCARYFVAALAAAIQVEGGSALVDAEMKALRRSALRRLVVTSAIGEAHAYTLVSSLPGSMVEVLPNVHIGDDGAKILGTFLASSKAMRILDLSSNRIGDSGAMGLGEGLKVNATLMDINLLRNQFSSEAMTLVQGAKSNGKKLKSLCGIEAGATSASFRKKGLGDATLIRVSLEP